MPSPKVTPMLTITKQLGHVSVQDLGRFTFQHQGFSASGAADEYAFLSGNYLLGNERNSAALEITFGQVTLTSHADCAVILTGADCHWQINRKAAKHWTITQLKAGDTITINAPKQGVYSYLCVSGGIQTPLYLSSRSSLPASMKGNDEITHFPIIQQVTSPQISDISPSKSDQQTIDSMRYYGFEQDILMVRFIPNKYWRQLTSTIKTLFCQQTYQLHNNSNKMGYRLFADTPLNITLDNNLSKPVPLGTIQIPSNGQPIVLMKDRQTIGGYPTLGCVINVDIPRLAQRRAGQRVMFLPISIEKAQAQQIAFTYKFTPNT